MGRAQALVGMDTKVRDLTGKADPAAALAVIDGWRESAAKLGEAQKELGKVRDREEAAAYGVLVKQGEDSGQITSANRAAVMKNYTTSAALGGYLETAPSALPGRATAGETPAVKSSGGVSGGGEAKLYKGKAYGDLTFSERAAWNKADPENWAAAKADYDRSKGG
jgi:hypothetical protein